MGYNAETNKQTNLLKMTEAVSGDSTLQMNCMNTCETWMLKEVEAGVRSFLS